MLNSKVLYIVVLLGFIFSGSHAFAGDMFTIKSVEISSEGDNARKAKDLAVLKGQRDAFEKLKQRLISEFSIDSVPEIEDEKLSSMVSGINITKEKITSKYYEGVVDFSFNPSLFQRFMNENEISYISKSSKPIIVLPVLYEGEDYKILQDNAWKKSWKIASKDIVLIDLKIFENKDNLLDKSNVDEIISGNISPETDSVIKNIIKKYNAQKILLAGARVSNKNSENLVNVTLSYLGSGYSEHTIRKFESENGESEHDLMTRAALDISQYIEKKWKEKQESLQIQKMKVSVFVPYKDLPQWNVIKNEIKNLDFVDSVDTKEITVDYAIVDFSFKNNYHTFVELLAEKNIYLEEDGQRLILQKLNQAPDWYLNKYKEQYYEF